MSFSFCERENVLSGGESVTGVDCICQRVNQTIWEFHYLVFPIPSVGIISVQKFDYVIYLKHASYSATMKKKDIKLGEFRKIDSPTITI